MLGNLVHAIEKLDENGAAILIRVVSFTVVAPMCKPMAKGKPVFLDEHFKSANCPKIWVQKHLRQCTHLRSPVPKHMSNKIYYFVKSLNYARLVTKGLDYARLITKRLDYARFVTKGLKKMTIFQNKLWKCYHPSEQCTRTVCES